ncbi:MAG: GIY-YIG nuclease family protein [Candidatus Pacearchaeota archaeon]|jgi:hypothetical protein|nr:hypothetical protein [Clostridia bacterium]
MENIYYVYALLDPRKPGEYAFTDFGVKYKPFYIGKGKLRRIYVHSQKAAVNYKRSHKTRTIKKILDEGLQPIEFFIKVNLEEEFAYTLEEKIISEIGLHNLTNCWPGGKGGRHNKNFTGKHHTQETKDKIRKCQIENNSMAGEKWHRTQEGIDSFHEKTAGENHHYFGKEREKETCAKISEKLKGIPMPDDEKEKRRKGMVDVWAFRKVNNVKIKKKSQGKKVQVHNQITGEIIVFESQKQCAVFLQKDFRTITKFINLQSQLNNFLISWI